MIITLQRVTAAGNRTRLTAFFGQLFYGSKTLFLLPFFSQQHTMDQDRSRRWQQIVTQVEAEYRQLAAAEKVWIAARLVQLEALQLRLSQLFEAGNGLQECRACLGECCAKGHNHMTLANLLSFLQRDRLPPLADFSRTCPFLGEQGCLLTIGQRPYNCITFVCDIIENSLTSTEVAEFYALEKQLRSLYQEFADRYAGAGLTGLLLQFERLNGQALLGLKQSAGKGRETV